LTGEKAIEHIEVSGPEPTERRQPGIDLLKGAEFNR
jgi:hypothetical protein